MTAGHGDFRATLRNFDFPKCAREVLPKIESLVISRSKQNYLRELIAEFIFLESLRDVDARRGGSQTQPFAVSHLDTFQEFQLILVLIEYFSKPGLDATRNAVFLSLFSSNLTPQRSRVLCKLISTSVSGTVASVLCSAGTWMQQVGCTTQPSLEVAESLISDFIIFSRRTPDQLKQLPLLTSHFAANFMAAIAELYMNDLRGTLVPPPDALLDVITEWVIENPRLCFASQQPQALPSGAIAMPVVTPIAGLLRWTILGPLVSQREAYINLHLGLLKTMLGNFSAGPCTALNAQHLGNIVGPLHAHASRLTTAGTAPTEDEVYEKSVDRFAQAVEISLRSNCLYSNIPQLLCALETLPFNRLLNIVIKENKK